MESKVQPTETTVADAQQSAAINTETGAIVPADAPSTEPVWQEWVDIAVGYLSRITEEIANFFSDYRKPLLNLLLLLSVAVTVYVTLAVLDAINNIPLLAPVFELVGLGYSAWFTYRYLLRASTRQELVAEFDALKTQVVGENQE
ncbi:MAG: CAAD domain-containing protein [Cyanophyceae cyanobacterium]